MCYQEVCALLSVLLAAVSITCTKLNFVTFLQCSTFGCKWEEAEKVKDEDEGFEQASRSAAREDMSMSAIGTGDSGRCS